MFQEARRIFETETPSAAASFLTVVNSLERCVCPSVLTRAGGSLPLQALPIGEGDDVSVGVHIALGAAAPHALHAVARAVGTGGSQGA